MIAGTYRLPRVATEVVDNPHEHRFEIRVDGELAGFTVYKREPGRITFLHTEIDRAFEGKGLGSTLAREALDAVRVGGEQVVARCPFIAAFIRRHPEYKDLLSPRS